MKPAGYFWLGLFSVYAGGVISLFTDLAAGLIVLGAGGMMTGIAAFYLFKD